MASWLEGIEFDSQSYTNWIALACAPPVISWYVVAMANITGLAWKGLRGVFQKSPASPQEIKPTESAKYDVLKKEEKTEIFSHKPLKPDKFIGEKDEDLGDYLAYFQTVGLRNGWTKEEYALNLSLSLGGTARQVWVDTNGPGPNKLTYEQLTKALQDRFQPQGQEKAYKAEFRLRMKKEMENYIEYGGALRRLARKAFPRSSADDQEEHAIEQFLSGLSQDMNVHISMHLTSVSLYNPNVRPTMNEVIRLAYDYELSTNKKSQQSKTVQSKPALEVSAISAAAPRNEQMDKLISQMDALKSEQVKANETLMQEVLGSRAVGCSECFLVRSRCCGYIGKQGHAVTCPNLTCWYCHKQGHMTDKCPALEEKIRSTKA